MKKLYYLIGFVIITLLPNCIEPFNIESIDFDDVLIVESTITNEFKNQEVKLNRTYRLNEQEGGSVNNAEVKVVDNLNNTFLFSESEPGIYKSIQKFKAIPNNSYKLIISTENGDEYFSEEVSLPSEDSKIDVITSEESMNDEGEPGISIYVSSSSLANDSKFYRYEYEETYKIVAERWSEYKAIVVSDTPPYEVDFVLKEGEQDKICFKTEHSKGIIQAETTGLSQDRVSNLLVRFIKSKNPIIRHRYSILVKQYTQSQSAFYFYKTLSKLSSSNNLFSQVQSGYIQGNISAKDEKKVTGFFEVSSVTTKRHFFNIGDVLSNFPSTPTRRCELLAPYLTLGSESPLIEGIKSGLYTFYFENDGITFEKIEGGPYIMVLAECGDCTKTGSNIKPTFWVD